MTPEIAGKAPMVGLRLPWPQYDRLNALVKAKGVTPSEVLRTALAEYLERQCDQGAAA